MRWVALFSIIVSMVLVLFYQSSNTTYADLQEFEKIAQYFDQDHYELKEVMVMTHVTVQSDEAEQFLESFQLNGQKPGYMDEKFNVINISENRVKVLYEFTSDEWSNETKIYLNNRLSDSKFRRFFEKGPIYSCFQAQTDAKISSNFITSEIRNYFDVNKVNEMIENNFTVISGATEQFDQYIPMDDEKINIQYAVRDEENEQKTVTIGTPILVIEY
ncbi:YwmB family TATA-box binding protein [Aquisalibacillus elongatus]|uniref:TATA-box binding protein n=1 Tax=Aquisalibacillus elongatus TaxID=485577 RepID=A0A3N5B8Q8_9BACI|nr:YwmB family TATA-box binding protein [Aquisalibacillus elongatus]RPF54116.1 TATA-box binding protein [Aquisalibacillus elongatus]